MSQGSTALQKGRNAKLMRRSFIGGSDARIIMGDDEAALLRHWRERRERSSGRICRAIS